MRLLSNFLLRRSELTADLIAGLYQSFRRAQNRIGLVDLASARRIVQRIADFAYTSGAPVDVGRDAAGQVLQVGQCPTGKLLPIVGVSRAVAARRPRAAQPPTDDNTRRRGKQDDQKIEVIQ